MIYIAVFVFVSVVSFRKKHPVIGLLSAVLVLALLVLKFNQWAMLRLDSR